MDLRCVGVDGGFLNAGGLCVDLWSVGVDGSLNIQCDGIVSRWGRHFEDLTVKKERKIPPYGTLAKVFQPAGCEIMA